MIKILVDGASDLTPSEAKEKNIILVPIAITIGENSYRVGENLEKDEFFQILTQGKEFPKTSQPSPQEFLDYFEEAKKNGDSVICLLLSSALSGTYQSAVLAKSMADYDQIYLIDTLSATVPIRVMADYAGKLIGQGLAAADIVEKLEQLKSRIKVMAAVDTLEYLCRGGRVSRAAAAIGEIANLKPVIAVMPDGTVGVLGKCLGRNKAISALMKQLQEHELDPEFPLYSLYSCGTENCVRFEQKVTQAGYTIDARMQLGPVIGTHVGPEAFGLIFVTK